MVDALFIWKLLKAAFCLLTSGLGTFLVNISVKSKQIKSHLWNDVETSACAKFEKFFKTFSNIPFS